MNANSKKDAAGKVDMLKIMQDSDAATSTAAPHQVKVSVERIVAEARNAANELYVGLKDSEVMGKYTTYHMGVGLMMLGAQCAAQGVAESFVVAKDSALPTDMQVVNMLDFFSEVLDANFRGALAEAIKLLLAGAHTPAADEVIARIKLGGLNESGS